MPGPIRIAILANGAQARREITSVNTSLTSLGRLAKGGLAAAGIYGLTAATVGFGASAVRTEAQFSTSMRLIQAATKASADQMSGLNDLALDLGAKTSFSASEAADAMLELAKAGLDTKTIMGGGVAGTLQLAAAGGIELGTAATIASNALNAFNLQGKDMAAIAAALAGGANASSASVESLGLGLAQVGAGAVNAGLSLQETVAALSAFDAAGIKGSDAGTSLKTMLARLIPTTTKANAAMEQLGLDFVKGNGQFESLSNIAQQLQERLGGLSQAQRVAALNTIFGSDASRAATVLMRAGAKGVEKYTKAANDQSAAQKMAAARMGGTAGALERLNGTVETAKLRLGQELAPAIIAGSNSLGKNLVPAMESAISGGKELVAAVKPAVVALADLVPSADAAGGVFNDVLIPTLTELSELVAGVAGFIDDLPGPIKTMGVEAGIAAFVLPRLTASVAGLTTAVGTNVARLAQWRAEMTYSVTRAQNLTAATSRLGSAAKTAAGVGGMVALAEGTKNAGTALGALETTAGGAALGFSVGGPWGAAIGGAGGLLYSFTQSSDAAAESQAALAEAQRRVTQTLNEQTGAFSKRTRQQFLTDAGDKGLLANARNLGIDISALTDTAFQGQNALNKMQAAALAAAPDEARADVVSLFTAISTMSEELFAGQRGWFLEAEGMRKGGAAARDAREDINTLVGTYGLVPKQARTVVQAVGAGASRRELTQLLNQFKVFPARKRAILELVGAGKLRTEAKGAKTALEDVGKAKPKTDVWLRALLGDTNAAQRLARKGSLAVGKDLAEGPSKARSNLQPWINSITGGARSAKGPASSGGREVGAQLKAGVISGFAGTLEQLSAMAAAAVRAAVASAKAAGRVKSPSKETEYIGRMLGEGLVVGMAKTKDDAGKAGKDTVRALLAGVVNGSAGVEKALDKIEGLVRKRINLKDNKAEEKREKAILKALRNQFQAIEASGKAQDKLNERLQTARDNLQGLQEQAAGYASTIQQSFIETGNLVNLGQNDAGKVSLSRLLSDLTKKAQRATQFMQLMQQLAAQGLSQTSLDQLLTAGPDAALETAQAIAAGGTSAIAQINALTAQIAGAGGQLGSEMATQFYGAGIQAAQGLVAGLESEAAKLDKIAKKLADTLVDAIKKKLGIKSPSRVFAELGLQSVRGLGIGLDEVYVRRQGTRLADSLTTGFGQPALSAYMSTTAGTGGAAPMRLHLTSDGLHQLLRGRDIQADLDAYQSQGGRSTQ